MSAREIDNQYKRIGGKHSYKDQRFDGMRSMLDDYTGQRVFFDSTKHTVDTSAQIDHVIPLHVVQKKYPDLSIEQQKAIANYAVTNAKLNMYVKNGKMNHQVIAEQFPENVKSTVSKVRNKDIEGAFKVSSNYARTSSNMLKHEAKASLEMTVDGGKYRMKNMTDAMKNTVSNFATTPERELLDCIGNSVKKSATGVMMGTVIAETFNAIKDVDDASTYAGNLVGRSAQTLVSVGGGTAIGELVGLGAIALGASPVGWLLAVGGTELVATGIISEATNDLAEDVSSVISEGVDCLRECPLIDEACAVVENLFCDVGGLWDNTFGLLF